ncbi:MAG: hypothetical protein MUF37_00405 [Methanoregulaceae archaeon]|jgi:hypothetical protein|nr:hypothetical protein [Methanoregulaceae archaeon]
MEIGEFLNKQVNETTSEYTSKLNDLKKFASEGKKSGIGVADIGIGKLYLLFKKGEPEGAVEIEKNGFLLGDKAIFLLKGSETFSFHPVPLDAIESYILLCRIFDRSHLTSNMSMAMPTIERRNEGTGAFTVRIVKGQVPQSGIHVSIRKQGRVIGSDVTTNEGKAYFKVIFGEYDCVVMDRDRKIRIFPVAVRSGGREETIEIG